MAEDNTANQKLAVLLLAKLGYKADVVANGKEALEALSRVAYDAVLMDCLMPEMDGFAATQEIRRREGALKHTPVIALTADVLKEDRERCFAVGMDDYISKPVEVPHLKRVLEKWCSTLPPSSSTPASQRTPAGDRTPSLDCPVDRDRLREISDGDENVLHKLIGIYLQQTVESLHALRAAIQAGDAATVHRIAHGCKGASLSYGMTAMIPCMQELENLAKQGNVKNALPALAQAQQEFENLQRYLQEYPSGPRPSA